MHLDLEFIPGERERVLEHHISRTGRPTKNMADGLPKHQRKPAMLLGSGFHDNSEVCHWVLLDLDEG
jgi:hypothetical protein